VVALGGLHVIGTERHESRRIDNQLRGRAGRQGDPGSSQFFVSMDDDLMRIFGGEKMKSLMNTLGLPEDMPIENKMISRSIESAQRKVEGHNFDIRKHLVEYDDVMNKHREVIYRKRRAILENHKSEGKNLKEEIIDILEDEVESIVNNNIEDEEKAKLELGAIIGPENVNTIDLEKLTKKVKEIYQQRESIYGEELARQIEKAVFLRTIDLLWVEHLTTMDELRTGISLRGYGQRDPLVEYKQEAYLLFQSLLRTIESNVAKTILKVEVQVPPTQPITRRPLEYKSPDANSIGGIERPKSDFQNVDSETNTRSETSNSQNGVTTVIREKGKSVFDRMAEGQSGPRSQIKNVKKVGRNDPCPCGSGKKYKKCCGR
jgi:preprotein translocase subunit SecA